MIQRILILIAGLATAAAAQEGFSVVVAKSSPETQVTRAQLRRMILAEATTWPSGAKVTVLLGPAGDAARAAALKQICGMTESEFSKFVLHLGFSGEVKSVPKSLPSTAAVRQLVQLNAGSVGIVAPGDVNDTVKVLQVH